MRERKVFLAVFLVVGFIMRIVSEVVHEVLGHGLLVLLLGGRITQLHISILWPYDFSYVGLNGVAPAQAPWIYIGGILACLCVSFPTQVVLIAKRKMAWYFSVTLFWLAFWTLVNSTGYLIIGGLTPFGDIHQLIALGVLTGFVSLIAGLILFALGFVVLSWILRRMLTGVFSPRKASLSIVLFWLIIPVLFMVMFANPERGLHLTYLPLSFIPALLSFIIEYLMFLSKQKTDANPNNISEE